MIGKWLHGKSAKVLLIPGLAAIFVGVLWSNARPSGSASAPAATTLAIPDASPLQSVSQLKKVSWPHFDLAQLVRFDPFDPWENPKDTSTQAASPPPAAVAPPDTTSSSATQEVERDVEEEVELTHKVELIYESSGGRVAIVDSRPVRVGDMLEDGQVIEITDSEIVIDSRVKPSDAGKE